MAAKADEKKAVMPKEFRRAHTSWFPKVKNKDGMLSVKCGEARITSTDEDGLVASVEAYAKAHGWEKVA